MPDPNPEPEPEPGARIGRECPGAGRDRSIRNAPGPKNGPHDAAGNRSCWTGVGGSRSRRSDGQEIRSRQRARDPERRWPTSCRSSTRCCGRRTRPAGSGAGSRAIDVHPMNALATRMGPLAFPPTLQITVRDRPGSRLRRSSGSLLRTPVRDRWAQMTTCASAMLLVPLAASRRPM